MTTIEKYIQIRRFMTTFNTLTLKTYIMVADGTVLLQFENIRRMPKFRLLGKSFPTFPLGGVITN